jgi:hypothetical protein
MRLVGHLFKLGEDGDSNIDIANECGLLLKLEIL